jgi:GH25 family lysozyme M1 (1,4-beta-N-acetylmuramidase)
MDRLGDYELWLAQYSNVPDFPYLFKGWQYTSEGSIPGITGDVDINVWFD